MLLRQVQAGPLQGHRLRALRRRGDALQGAPRAHGPHRPRGTGLAHLVLQGRPEPDRIPDRHGSEGAREGALLRRLDRHLGGRGGAQEGPQEAREGGRQGPRLLPGREGPADQGAGRVPGAPAGVPQDRLPGRLLRRGPSLGRRARGQRQEALRGRPREAREGDPQGDRGRDRRHRGLSRRRRRAHARGLEDLPGDEGQGRDQRRGDVPRAQGPLRVTVRLGRVLPRRDGRRGRARPARPGRPRGRVRGARGHDQHLEGPEAGPRR